MDFNTKLVQESVAQIATLLSDLMVAYVPEEEDVGMGEIEQGMRQILQAVGREHWDKSWKRATPSNPAFGASASIKPPIAACGRGW